MNVQLAVADISTYLEHTGWRRHPDPWRGAAVWTHKDAYDVLVPARDGMGDGDLRVTEIVDMLATVEQRSPEEIARDISSPLADQHWYRTHTRGVPSGFTTLKAGLNALRSVEIVLGSAARAAVDGPHFSFAGRVPAAVGTLVDRVELGPTRAGSYVFPVRVPLGEDPELTRRVSSQLLDATVAVREAVDAGDPAAFDATVTAGVSAELCEGMRGLAGASGREPFEIGFRWARGLPTELPAAVVDFPEDAGELIETAADRLRRHGPSGEVTVTGLVEVLHDQPRRNDRWRIRVRGEVAGTKGNRRVLWVRLPGQDTYHAAITAHQSQQRVRARGALSDKGTRAELVADDFEVLG
ncbi:hypothetical protein [Actinophytocola gossypii]|uniref:Uncharacterized protein n=1 Tax=Actinophytocola gossypii TaxID=2812003 RepID=A0ABT2JGW5_9PSEU|nr:hypothetical protein [Actinophytocola gossypii]MCT2587011.1 hypothetical protein [Actinophytocola gossypii]